MNEPRTDALASARSGLPMEALDGVAAAQPRPVGRWLLSHDDFEHLWSVRSRGIVSRATRRSPSGIALHEAGLTTALGALTDDGQRIAAHLERPDVRFAAVARTGGTESHWGMWLSGSSALVRSGTPVSDLVAGATPSDRAQVDVIPAGRAVGQLVAWMNLAPAWAIAPDDELVVDDSVIEDRVTHPGGPVAPCPSDDPVLRRLWDAPTWVRIRAWSESSGRGTDVIAAASAGYFRPVPTDDGRRRIEPVPSGTVFRDVLAMFSTAG